MILLIDNYDSFVYNLFQALRSLGEEVVVARNDRMSVEEVEALAPKGIVLSPGPGHPGNRRDFGVCQDILRESAALATPILGVCLGHQGIIHHFGGKVVRNTPMHGKMSEIDHSGKGILQGVPSPARVMRYHSLVGTEIPDCLEVTARSRDDHAVMAVQHRTLPICGVQFHPESIMTQDGLKMLENFAGRGGRA